MTLDDIRPPEGFRTGNLVMLVKRGNGQPEGCPTVGATGMVIGASGAHPGQLIIDFFHYRAGSPTGKWLTTPDRLIRMSMLELSKAQEQKNG